MDVRNVLLAGVCLPVACGDGSGSGETGEPSSSVTTSSDSSSSPGDTVAATEDAPSGDDGASGESESETGDDGGDEPVDPGYPDYPEVIDTLSVTVRTADVEFAGTNDGHLSLCLTAETCFVFDTVGTEDQNLPWPNEFARTTSPGRSRWSTTETSTSSCSTTGTTAATSPRRTARSLVQLLHDHRCGHHAARSGAGRLHRQRVGPDGGLVLRSP